MPIGLAFSQVRKLSIAMIARQERPLPNRLSKRSKTGYSGTRSATKSPISIPIGRRNDLQVKPARQTTPDSTRTVPLPRNPYLGTPQNCKYLTAYSIALYLVAG